MKSLKLAVVAISLVGIFGVGNAMAAASATVDVTANVLSTCKFSIGNPQMAFGPIDPTSGATYTADAAIKFTCTQDTPWNFDDVAVTNAALGGGGLFYSVPTGTPSGSGNGEEQTVTITGSIIPAQYVDAVFGTYSTTQTVTINY